MSRIKKILRYFLLLVLVLAVGLVATAKLGYRPLPDNSQRPASQRFAAADTAATLLGKAVAKETAAHPGLTGIFPLYDGHDAFAARTVLADVAERSIDAQYFIWRDDTAGHLVFQALLKAANRGVRVRLLLDDNNTPGMDGVLLALDQHPNIEVRLFNPFMQRQQRVVGFMSDFYRLNRRMHNKSFTVDNQITVMGGRNVADEYYETGVGMAFADLDVAAVGPVVDATSQQFDQYWESAAVYPASAIIPADTQPAVLDGTPRTDAATQAYLKAVAASTLMQQLQQGDLPLHWTTAEVISDHPGKGLGEAPKGSHVLDKILPVMLGAQQELSIVSAYFVPTQAGTDLLVQLRQKPVEVKLLTNSLSATDVLPVHAGYARYRDNLLRAGVKIHELKRGAAVAQPVAFGPGGSSDASLHAKVFSVDRKHIFIGSFNMDPRSADLNTEMGLLLESPVLAQLLEDALAQKNPVFSYELEWRDQQVLWHSHEGGATYTWKSEPDVSWQKRALTAFLALLPIEHLL
ncbi:MAG: phospholipase D family protein [Brachymonas sp.]|nr:phospholipase D family protein [Brachymonas sp.]